MRELSVYGGGGRQRVSHIGRTRQNRLVIMAKLPVMGLVKTRLARQLGPVTATWFYRHTMRSVIGRLAHAEKWRSYVAVSPDTAALSPVWPAALLRLPQGGGDLGARMHRLLSGLPPGPTLVVGTDIPGIERRHVERAFRALARADVVFGPTGDGGYWAVGVRRTPVNARMFAGVRWSSLHALADSKRSCAGSVVAEADVLHDVDDAEEYVGARAAAGRMIRPRA